MADKLNNIVRPAWPVMVMTIIAAATLGICSGSVGAPLIICGLLLLHLATGIPRLARPRTFYAVLLMVPFGLWIRFGAARIMLLSAQVPVGFLAVVGFYMLTLATHHLLALRSGGSRDYAMACAVMGMGIAGAFNYESNPLYTPTLLVFVVLLLWYVRREIVERRADALTVARTQRDWWPYASMLLVLVLLTMGVHQLFVQRIDQMSNWAMRMLAPNFSRPSEIGFSETSRLRSISKMWGGSPERASEVVLEVFGEYPGAYMRGAVYQSYNYGTWQPIEDRQIAQPEGTDGGRNMFNISTVPATKQQAMVYPASDMSKWFFMPLGTHQVATFVDRVKYTPLQAMKPKDDSLAGGYAIYDVVGRPPPPTEADLAVPPHLRSSLQAFARGVVPAGSTPRQIAESLTQHFNTNFHYEWGIELRSGEDPVLQFLNHFHKGHCEYFASAGCLLLRTCGVPARYGTGFMLTEEGLGGGSWVARRRDAHAWIEAYLPPQGWTVVEMTPGAELPTNPANVKRATGAERLMLWFRLQWDRLTSLAFYGGAKALINAFLDFIASIPQRLPIWAWVILAIIGVGWVTRKDIIAYLRRGRAGPADLEVRQLQIKLREAEKMLRRHGLVRRPSMTVASFLRLVESAVALPPKVREHSADLLGQYLRRRFRPMSGEPDRK